MTNQRVVLITGASRGIGAATAKAFARESAAVVLAARDAAALDKVVAEIESTGGTALAVPTDITDEDAVRNVVDTAVERFGGLHAAFNNAGGSSGGMPTPLGDIDSATFDAVVGANLRGMFLCLRYELPAIEASGGGAIVNMSSTAGIRIPVQGIGPYATAKHGVGGITAAAAYDYAARGVRVNAVAPGPILTERLAQLPQEALDRTAAGVPMNRMGTTDEVAAAVTWLCSDAASFITGVTVPIDGGQAI